MCPFVARGEGGEGVDVVRVHGERDGSLRADGERWQLEEEVVRSWVAVRA